MKLRSKPIANLSVDAVKIMLKKKVFFMFLGTSKAKVSCIDMKALNEMAQSW